MKPSPIHEMTNAQLLKLFELTRKMLSGDEQSKAMLNELRQKAGLKTESAVPNQPLSSLLTAVETEMRRRGMALPAHWN